MSTTADGNDCTLSTCPIESSIYRYRPSLGANTTLLVLFAIAMVIHAFQGWRWKQVAFGIIMSIGCFGEVAGYVGRIISWNNPFDQSGFLTQICSLTVAPAFFAAAIYLCISKIVAHLGPEVSRLSPRQYLWIFIPCDIVSLTLQGAGGGISSVTSQNGEDPSLGSDIMIAGLSFQVFTLTLFMLLCADYAFRYLKARRSSDQSSSYRLRTITPRFRLFVVCLLLATLCIFIRSVYRVIELAGGWEGELVHDEPKFIVLEGVMVILAVFLLNVGHPGPAFDGTSVIPVEDKAEA